MAERIVKFRLITYFNLVDSPVNPNEQVLVEKIGHMGQKVDINRQADLDRLDELGALYSDDEAAEIEAGTYSGPEAALLYNSRNQTLAATPGIEAADGEHGDVAGMDAPTLAEYIKENRLNVDSTVALAGDDEGSIQKVLDAENIATENEPRKGVTDRLEAKLIAANS